MTTRQHPARPGAGDAATAERLLRGLGVSPGIAIGPAHVMEAGAIQVPEYCVADTAVDEEVGRFHGAVEKARRQLGKLKSKAGTLPADAAADVATLLEAHQAMLSGSRLIRGVEKRIRAEHLNAESAVQQEITVLAQSFAAMDDAYLAARVADVREVGRRLIRNLMETPYQAFSRLPNGAIILAEELSPADTALLDPRRIGGFATVLGGAEGHTAIMARSLGLPAVLGAAGLLQGVETGDLVVVDGRAGRVLINPSDDVLADYRQRQALWRAEREQLKALAGLPAITRDGTNVTLNANLELPRELDGARDGGAAGVGLLRTEFLYMNRDDLPGEEEQYQVLRDLVIAMEGKPVTARTLDVGGEKLAGALAEHFATPANPALGLRAIRLGLKEPKLLETQLAAMLRAGAHGPIRILVPMISNPSEMRKVRDLMRAVARRLLRRGHAIADPLPPLGAMIEIPGAALAADSLASVSDFFAIGTNDLIQYTLAIDRGDEQVAYLYDPLHPAVLRLVQFTVEAAGRAGIPVSVCGEMAGDPRYAALLLGLGVRELSMAPGNLPLVKRRVRGMDLREAARRAGMIMGQTDSGRIAALLDDFNEALG
ncbi:phosphoenolpyruvate--protein phosphotransferase [Niveispirillum lacus]|uniref:Phosphoenolpyruvate-protein phosphotransferase n=1 Tax=Niveispirillum lacus TaxID=1981099 RepID=A0A255Z5S7_9PROT|nr:phosphoenolpyruvate--protein phosphotransferase [Niveispirillum lacus]OYQ35970.1 phosphoenolpyruvate--protein phosphotransferase [Niveispirillum lacus]